jgi:membrane protein required for beta-lactamase induction
MPAPNYRAIAERRLTDRLLLLNAVWPGSGQPLEDLHSSQRRALTRLVADGVIREEGAGRFYLDAPAYAAHMASRRKRAMIALIVVILAMALTTGGALAGVFPR